MYRIRKEFHFSASHCLEGLAEDHPCSSMHGHNYVVTVELSSPTVDRVGMVTDYRALEDIKRYIDEKMDHKHLNRELTFNPTAENMARFIFEKFTDMYPQLNAVEISETPKTTARYEG